jgi:outer membrane protein assembly factor BamB
MTRFPKGGPLLYAQSRPRQRSVFVIFLLVALVLAACGQAVGGNNNWPGLSTDGQSAYVAIGPSVYALDIAGEELRWQYPVEAGRASFFASPAISGDRMLLGDYGASGGTFSSNITVSIYGLDDLTDTSPGTLWTPVSGVARDRIVAPPLLTETQAFVGTADGVLYALDAEDGAVQWSFAAEHAIWGQPVVYEGVIYFTSLDKRLYALDTESGEALWQHEFAAAIPSAPVVSQELIYIGGFDSHVHAVSRADGAEVWSYAAQDWLWGAPALDSDGETLYFADRAGNAYAVNAQNGEEIWQVSVTEHIQAAPVVNGERLYIAASIGDSSKLEDLTGEVLALNKENGEVIWRKATAGPVFTAPVLVENKLVVVFKTGARINNLFQVNVYNQTDGDLIWEFVPAE